MNNTLPLLSNSLRVDLEAIYAGYDCRISKALLDADIDQRTITNYARMLSIRPIEAANIDEPVEGGVLAFSFLPKGKEPVYSGDKWGRQNRQTAKPAKVAYALLEVDPQTVTVPQIKLSNRWYEISTEGNLAWLHNSVSSLRTLTDEEKAEAPRRMHSRVLLKYPDSEYEKFTNNLKSYFECKIEFKLVSGSDIPKYYSDETYYQAEGSLGTLWSSCMRDVPGSYFEMYEKSSSCKMLVAFYCDKVVGRALVWETDKGIMMDRIYYYREYLRELFIAYARQQKWIYKQSQSSDTCTEVMKPFDDTYISDDNCNMQINVCEKPKRFPYMDTFKYYNVGNQVISNDSCYFAYDYMLQSTDGLLDDDDDEYVTCYITGNEVHQNDATYIDGYGEYVESGHAVFTYDDVAILRRDAIQLPDGSWAEEDDPYIITRNDGVLDHIENCHYIDALDVYALHNETVELHNGEMALKTNPDIVETEDGDYAYRKDCEINAETGNYTLTD